MTITQWIIGGTTVFLILYDIVIALTRGAKATISTVIYGASKRWPLIPFAFGLLMGHFFFPIAIL